MSQEHWSSLTKREKEIVEVLAHAELLILECKKKPLTECDTARRVDLSCIVNKMRYQLD